MTCRICLRGTCVASFHSLEEQENWSELLDAYDDADYLKDENRKQITLLEEKINCLEEEIDSAYDKISEIRHNILNSRA